MVSIVWIEYRAAVSLLGIINQGARSSDKVSGPGKAEVLPELSLSLSLCVSSAFGRP